jgi:hypothetical protein
LLPCSITFGVLDTLAIPTTKDEVEDGLTLVHNEMVQDTYNASSVSKTPKVIEQGSNGPGTDSSNLGDNEEKKAEAPKTEAAKAPKAEEKK